MNGIVINIDPIVFQIGSYEVRWYSLAIMLAVVAAVFIAAREGRRKGLPSDFIYSLAPWLLVAGLIGARLFHVIDNWEYYAGNPWQIFQVQQGGLAIWGGLLAGGAAVIAYARVRHVPLGRLADTLVPALLAAQIIGRIGCIVNGDAYGGITNLPWAFIYAHPDALIPGALFGVPTHPYPAYEILWNGTVLLAFLKLRHSFTRDGLLFLGYLSLYSLGRFVLTFVRQENTVFWQLQQAEVIAIVILVISAGALVYLLIKNRRHHMQVEVA